ncbi:MAG: DUF3048 domain-containing protein [Anaerolineaceae bacterium]
MKKTHLLLLPIIAIVLLVTACEGGASTATLSSDQATAVAQTLTALTPTASPTSENTPTILPTNTATVAPTNTPIPVTAIGPNNFPADVNPLTGLKVEDPTLLDRRPVMIKVANYPAIGRPHAGLSYADIVWEYYIGGGSNRFMALYYGQDCEKVGPVRSGRMVDPELVTMYQGVLAFSGANEENVLPRINQVLGNRTITENVCPGLCRDDWTVTGVFGNTADITDLMQTRGVDITDPDLTGMLFDTVVPSGGEEAEKATLFFNYYDKGDWVYDQESGKYLRWIEDGYNYDLMIPLVDRLTNEQLAFSNVIMVYTYYTERTSVLHEIGIWDNTEGQKAVVFRDGQAFDVIWKTTNQEKPMQFFDKEGNLFPLKPGNTWIGLIGTTSTVQVSDGDWTFTFSIP